MHPKNAAKEAQI